MDDIGAIEDGVGQVYDLLAHLSAAPVAGASDEQLCALTVAVEKAGRLLDAMRTKVAGEIDERSGFERGTEGLAFRFGHQRGWQLLEQLTRVSPAEARRRTLLGKATRGRTQLSGESLPPQRPAVAEALQAGTVGLDAAESIVRCLEQATATACPSPEHVEAAEAALVEAATQSTADEVAVQARAWREALDPDGAEPRDERIHRKRSFRLGREKDGLTGFSGLLAPTDAALLQAAFHEADRPGNEPRFLSEQDIASGTVFATNENGETEITVVDSRTRDQRHYDVVTGLLAAGVRSTGQGPGEMRSTAQITAIITLDDLRKRTGVGWIDGIHEPVSSATIEQLVCASGYAPILLGDQGEVLMLGRERRLFSPAQMKALAVRDGGCVNCGAPPGWCEGHHVEQWAAEEGPTDIDNGALLCSACHRMIHRNQFTLRMIDGRPHILAPPWVDPDQIWRPLGNKRLGMIAALR